MNSISAPSFLKERQQKSNQLYANEERLSQQDPKGPDISAPPQSGLKEGVSSLDLHNEFVRKRMALRQPCHTHDFDFAKNNKDFSQLTKEINKAKAVLVERNNIRRDCDSLLAHSELARKILALQRGEAILDPRQSLHMKKSVAINKNPVKHLNINTEESHIAISSQHFNANHNYETLNTCKEITSDSANFNFDKIQENNQNEIAQLKEFEAQALKEFASESFSQVTKDYQGHLPPLQNCHEVQNSINNTFSRNSFGLPHEIRPMQPLAKRQKIFKTRDSVLERARKVRCSLLQNFNGTQMENHNSLVLGPSRTFSSITVRVLHFSNHPNDIRSNHMSVPCEIIEHFFGNRSLIKFPESARSITLDVKDQILVNFIFQLPNSKPTKANINRNTIQPGNEIVINSPVTYIGSSGFLSNDCSAKKSFTDLKAAIVAFAFSIK